MNSSRMLVLTLIVAKMYEVKQNYQTQLSDVYSYTIVMSQITKRMQ